MKKAGKGIIFIIGSVFIVPSAIAGLIVGMIKLGYKLGNSAFE